MDETNSVSTTDAKFNYKCADERRFVFYQKDANELFADKIAEEAPEQHAPVPAALDNSDFQNQTRAGGGAKGKTGSTDFTRGKNAFVRPCTVGWKSQNQPLARGGGKRTPRQKG